MATSALYTGAVQAELAGAPVQIGKANSSPVNMRRLAVIEAWLLLPAWKRLLPEPNLNKPAP